jgi:3-methyladenine DNA glycosylase Tag
MEFDKDQNIAKNQTFIKAGMKNADHLERVLRYHEVFSKSLSFHFG